MPESVATEKPANASGILGQDVLEKFIDPPRSGYQDQDASNSVALVAQPNIFSVSEAWVGQLSSKNPSIVANSGSGLKSLGVYWSAEHLCSAIEAARVALWSWNVDDNSFRMDPRGFELWGVPVCEHLEFEQLSERIHPADIDRVRTAFVATRLVPGPYEIDFRISVGDKFRWISARGQGADEGIVDGVMFGIIIDVTDRKDAEDHNKILAGEMSHRVKNLLAIAIGLIAFTSRTSKSIEDMTSDLTRRLMALGRAHDLVRPVRRPGAQKSSPLLGDLIAVLLAPYDIFGCPETRIQVAVPKVGISEQGASTFAMILHELATDSAKYGALSRTSGSLHISGAIDDMQLKLVWKELGGPKIESAPTIEGFGSKMIAQLVTTELGGSITYDWQATGLVATICATKGLLAR